MLMDILWGEECVQRLKRIPLLREVALLAKVLTRGESRAEEFLIISAGKS